MTALFDRLARLFEDGHARGELDLLSDSRFADLDRTADAAVLIAVTDRHEPGVILTQRPSTMRDHPGQVAFPGGKLDPEKTPLLPRCAKGGRNWRSILPPCRLSARPIVIRPGLASI